MNPYWLRTDDGNILELNSGTAIRVRPEEDNLVVVLQVAGAERELYRGPSAREYVAGLARAFLASDSEGLIKYGTPKKKQ